MTSVITRRPGKQGSTGFQPGFIHATERCFSCRKDLQSIQTRVPILNQEAEFCLPELQTSPGYAKLRQAVIARTTVDSEIVETIFNSFSLARPSDW